MRSVLIISTMELDFGLSEAQELVNVLANPNRKVILLQSMHSSLELYRSLRDSPYDLVWIASHSGPEGFKLQGEILRPEELGLFLLEASSSDAVLNSCYSVEHVNAIQKISNVNILATIQPEGIADEEAWTAAMYLGRSISKTGSLQKSYHQLLAGKSYAYHWFPAPNPRNTIVSEAQIQDRLKRVEDLMEGLIRTLQGDSFSRQKGLLQAAEDFQQEMRGYIRADQDWKRQTEERIRQVEKDSSSGKTLIVPLKTAIYLIISFAICAMIILYLTNMLQG